MSDESNEVPGRGVHDEFAAWRGLLRQPAALPEHGLADREAAWDKLFERLNERPRRLLFSYRVAAACILILLIPAARFFQNRPAPGPRRPLAQPVVPLAVAPVVRQQSGPGHPAAAPAISRRMVASSPMAHPSDPPAIRRPAHRPILMHPEPLEAAARDTAPPMLAAAPPTILLQPRKPKKQWKVIDLNELDPQPQRPHNLAVRHDPRPPGLTINLSSENR